MHQKVRKVVLHRQGKPVEDLIVDLVELQEEEVEDLIEEEPENVVVERLI